MSYPTTPRPKRFALGGLYPTLVGHSFSRKRQARTRGAHRFTPILGYDGLYRAEWAPLISIVESLRGRSGTIELPVFGMETRRGAVSGIAAGNVKVDGAVAKGASSVPIKGLTNNLLNAFLARDLVRFAGHKKLYSVFGTVNADGTGKGTLVLNQDLEADLVNNEVITTANVTVCSALTSDTVPDSWGGGLISPPFELQWEEDPQ